MANTGDACLTDKRRDEATAVVVTIYIAHVVVFMANALLKPKPPPTLEVAAAAAMPLLSPFGFFYFFNVFHFDMGERLPTVLKDFVIKAALFGRH